MLKKGVTLSKMAGFYQLLMGLCGKKDQQIFFFKSDNTRLYFTLKASFNNETKVLIMTIIMHFTINRNVVRNGQNIGG